MLKEIILKQIYDFKRKFYARKITHKLGKCFFRDYDDNDELNEIDCYVRERKIRKTKKRNDKGSYYEIDLTKAEQFDDAKKKYDLDKPIHYVFDNIDFAFGITLNVGDNAMVSFRNCMFNGPVQINGNALEVSFNSNMYRCSNPVYLGHQPFFECHARKLVFDNETFSNSFPCNERLESTINFGMDIDVDSLRILNDSSIYIVEPNSKTSIKANEITLYNCSITCPDVIIVCANLGMSEAGIAACKKISIYNRNNGPLKKIMSPEVIYNGQKVEPNDEQEIALPTNPTVITSAQLKELRQELVSKQTPQIDTDKIPVLK